ncbi:MAG: hypothetical protein P8Z49_12140 [Acidobacteriota bacterium]
MDVETAAKAPVRRALGFRTVFNTLGPLCNPACVKRQLIGVPSVEILGLIGEVLAALDTERALVVHTPGPYDEVALTGVTRAVLVTRGETQLLEIAPRDLGLSPVAPVVLAGGAPEENARRIVDAFTGEDKALANVICANAGCALFAAGAARNPYEGFAEARKALAGGRALEKLDALRAFSRSGRHDDVAD